MRRHLAAVTLVVLVVGCAPGGGEPAPVATASAEPGPEPSTTAPVPPAPTPAPTASSTSEPEPDTDDGGEDGFDGDSSQAFEDLPPPREATAADAAAYIRDVVVPAVPAPSGVAVDLDGDGVLEVLLTGVLNGRGWVGVATWNGTDYGIVDQDDGGPGDRVVDVSVSDVNADGTDEVVLDVGGSGTASLAIWAIDDGPALRRLPAQEGCHDGSHVYGVIGADLTLGPGPGLDVVASCDDSPLPVADWSSQTWRWARGAFRLVPEPAPEPAPQPSPAPNAGSSGDTPPEPVEDDDAAG